ncbi:MAG: LLM class flavin-dependent oxidoreductase [Thaumarchaeota archaeon]|nr:LLM class flavin-dependent oxidoreductase [Nitrososphaerota archaeon]
MSGRKLSFSHELVGDNVHDIVEQGVNAEKFGFDFVWVPDHLVDIHPLMAIFDAWTTLATIGAKTESIRLASGVTDIQRMHPAKIANIISTLDHLTSGRAVLGIGAGEIMNTKPYGIEWEKKEARLKRLRETLQVIKLLWKSTFEKPVSFSGDFYSLDRAHLSLPPFQKGPPIYIGSWSSKETLRIAGEFADGWYPGSQNTVEGFREKAQIIKNAATAAGRPSDSIDIMVSIPTLVLKDKNQVEPLKKEIKNALKKKLLLNQYMWEVFGLNRNEISIPRELEYQFATPGQQYDEALSKTVEKLQIPDEILEKAIERMIAVGSADECISKIEKYVNVGATHIFFSSLLGTRENYRLIGEEIIPRLRTS